MHLHRRPLHLAVFVLTLAAGPLTAQVQQAGAPAGTLPLNNVAPAARDALFAALDAVNIWAFAEAADQANRALAADSSFALARALRARISQAPTVPRLNAEYARAAADAQARPVPEQTYVLAMRAAGVNLNRLLATVRAFYPNDRRVALDHTLSFIADERVDILLALSRRFPDLVGAKMWLAYYLTIAPYTTSRADEYEALTAAWDAVRLAPQTAGAHAALGHVLQRMGRDDDALAHLNAATRMDPRQEYAFVLKSDIYSDDGKPRAVDRARAALDSAIAVNPHATRRITQRQDRAFLLYHDGRAAEGMAELVAIAKESEANGGTPAVLYTQMAGLAAGTGDSASVEKWMLEARRIAGNADISIQSAQAYATNRQPVEARKAIDEFKRRADTTTVAYRYNLTRLNGMALLAEGKAADALAELKRSDPLANTFAQLAMIDAYVALKDQKGADETRAALLARKDIGNAAISKAIARYRATKKR